MTTDEIRQLLSHPDGYRQPEWRSFLKGIFPTAEIFAVPDEIRGSNDDLPTGYQLGRVMLADGRRIAFIEQPVPASTNLIRNRVSLRNRVAKLIDQESATGVLAVFTQVGSPNFRLSFVARESSLVFTEEGAKTQRTETAQKRFTYYLGRDEACTTAAQRFEQLAKLGTAAEFPHLIEAFSVEKLNDEFFRDFSSAVSRVKAELQSSYPKWTEVICRTEAQTLLNRLVFLYFVQRKGWLNRQPRFLAEEFAPHKDKQGHTFFTKFLGPLFECLSTEPSLAPAFPHDVPFLNGGLFSDEADADDPDIQRRVKLNVSNAIFADIFANLLDRYNFTIVEDSPSSVEVAIDPEMLGRVFEALVLQQEESDTGGKSRRHDTGSHYTPRPIVHYLCREALAGWLEGQAPFKGQAEARKKIDTLLLLDASDGIDESILTTLANLFTPEEAADLTRRLLSLRMCDPAVGSGAFPLGFLHALLNVIRLCEARSRGQDPAEGDRHWLYETKKKIIEQVIYGVDIQPQAIELCKLRLWLSLMVDHELSADPFRCSQLAFQKALRQLEPLPNLDFKIRPANSLLDLIHGQRLQFDARQLGYEALGLLTKLTEAKHGFFQARLLKDKRKLRLTIYEAYSGLGEISLRIERAAFGRLGIGDSDEENVRIGALERATEEMKWVTKQVKEARRAKNDSSLQDQILEAIRQRLDDPSKATFVWKLDFAEVFFEPGDTAAAELGELPLTVDGELGFTRRNVRLRGFDLMLGNPPFIRLQTLKKTDPELTDYFKTRFISASKGNYDLYVCFVERGMELLHAHGQLAYILPHKFFNAQYGQALRGMISQGRYLRHVVHFGDQQIFPGATNYVCLLFLAKAGADACRFMKADDLHEWQRTLCGTEGQFEASEIGEKEWAFAVGGGADVFTRLANMPVKLGDICDLFVGLQTSADTVFLFKDRLPSNSRTTLCYSKELSESFEIESAILKPVLRSGKIGRYWAKPTASVLFPYRKSPNGLELIPESTLKAEYPLAHLYLSRNKKLLEEREHGKFKRLGWHSLYPKNLDFWEQPKLMLPYMITSLAAHFDDSGMYFVNVTTGGFGLTLRKANGSLKALTAVLNSKVLDWYFKKVSTTFHGGYYAANKQFLVQLPIPNTTPPEEVTIVCLVDWLLWLHQQNSVRTGEGGDARDPLIAAYFEQWVNGLVYELFFPAELHSAGIRLFDLAASHLPPMLNDVSDSARLPTIRQVFEKLHEVNHPVSVALFSLGSVAEVRIIEGRE